jgi:hypothetical protein
MGLGDCFLNKKGEIMWGSVVLWGLKGRVWRALVRRLGLGKHPSRQLAPLHSLSHPLDWFLTCRVLDKGRIRTMAKPDLLFVRVFEECNRMKGKGVVYSESGITSYTTMIRGVTTKIRQIITFCGCVVYRKDSNSWGAKATECF